MRTTWARQTPQGDQFSQGAKTRRAVEIDAAMEGVRRASRKIRRGGFAECTQARPIQRWIVSYQEVTGPSREERGRGWCLGVCREIETRAGGVGGRFSLRLELKTRE